VQLAPSAGRVGAEMHPDARRAVTFDFIAMIQTAAAGIAEWLHRQIVKSASYEPALRAGFNGPRGYARVANASS